ncbi:Uncharacterized protein TCM_020206 [Theobroma cacao]|uniref:Uncharacterized protein n=1 Tax=Theobroma cacao TaxID=3641 RepID=A0A061EKE0_THECC|nr:Uncharacterized protein TCM_020206 [Theobroma cacao]
MAKFSSAWKRKKSWSFSEMEMDVARQLMQLCKVRNNTGNNKGTERKNEEKEENESNRSEITSSTVTIDQYPLEEEEDEHLQPRKRRYKSIDSLYRSTKPLSIQNAKKMKV